MSAQAGVVADLGVMPATEVVARPGLVPDMAADWFAAPAYFEAFKRVFDVAFALTGLVLGFPLWLAFAVAVRLSSPGPILYSATVVGKDGRPFTWYKFRTMRVADDGAHREWLRDFVEADKPYNGQIYKLWPDPRVTRIGALLRKSSLDEIPQLWNVLRGEMSLVGPRPPIAYEYELYDEVKRRRLAVRPGITGLHQVTGRATAPFSQMLASDLEYIRRRSIRLDLWIVVRTVGVVLTGRGAA